MIKKLKQFLGKKWKRLYKPIFFTIMDTLGYIGSYTVLFMSALDVVHSELTYRKLWIYMGILLICVIYRIFIYRYGYLLCFESGFDISKDVRVEFGDYVTNFNLGYFDKNGSGYLLNTLTGDMTSFEGILSHSLPFCIKAIVAGSLLVIAMIIKDYRLGLIQLICLLVALPLLKKNKQIIQDYGNKKRNAMNKIIDIAMEYIDGIKVFKSHNSIGSSFKRLTTSMKDESEIQLKAEKAISLPNSLYFLVVSIGTPIILFVGGVMMVKGILNMETYIILMLMSICLTGIFISFEHYYIMLMDLSLALDNINGVYNLKALPYEKTTFHPNRFNIKFDKVHFQYVKDKKVLHGVSFEIKEGTKTALIGKSGSGKSTVMNLIVRFWDPTNGSITIGGENISKIKPEALLENMSEVFQDNILLNDTIKNNIRLGNPQASEHEIIKAAKLAYAHEFIIEKENGYDTVITGEGDSLSGGEKQRIAIARAIIKNAPILLLDESTASLDPDNEAKINQALDYLMEGKTTIVIAHRLNTIRNADQIIVMDKGQIEEIGNHDELMKKQDHYYEMIKQQEDAINWNIKKEVK